MWAWKYIDEWNDHKNTCLLMFNVLCVHRYVSDFKHCVGWDSKYNRWNMFQCLTCGFWIVCVVVCVSVVGVLRKCFPFLYDCFKCLSKRDKTNKMADVLLPTKSSVKWQQMSLLKKNSDNFILLISTNTWK